MNDNQLSAVPRFDLYGEADRPLGPGFVHIEDIAARSRRHNWLIRPHRHGKLWQMICLQKGNANVSLDASQVSLTGHWAVTIPPGTVHGFSFSPETEGWVLTLQENVLVSGDGQRAREFDGLFHTPGVIEFSGHQVLFGQLSQYLSLLMTEFSRHQPGQEHMMRWLAKSVLLTLARQCAQMNLEQSGQSKRDGLMWQFRNLVEEHFRQHWRVADYADALNTSVSTLNRNCLDQHGQGAKHLIDARMLIEIKRRLIYTRESLDAVSWSLGFKDPSYFSRFFKKHTGTSPGAFRKEQYRQLGTT